MHTHTGRGGRAPGCGCRVSPPSPAVSHAWCGSCHTHGHGGGEEGGLWLRVHGWGGGCEAGCARPWRCGFAHACARHVGPCEPPLCPTHTYVQASGSFAEGRGVTLRNGAVTHTEVAQFEGHGACRTPRTSGGCRAVVLPQKGKHRWGKLEALGGLWVSEPPAQRLLLLSRSSGWQGMGCRGHRAPGVQEQLSRMRQGLAATLREQRSWKCSTFPLLPGHLCRTHPAQRCQRCAQPVPCHSELSLVPSIPAGHDGCRGQEAAPRQLLGTLGICGSAPALIQPGSAGSHPGQTFLQLSSFPSWHSLLPALPCSPWVPDPASPDRHSSPAGSRLAESKPALQAALYPEEKSSISWSWRRFPTLAL